MEAKAITGRGFKIWQSLDYLTFHNIYYRQMKDLFIGDCRHT